MNTGRKYVECYGSMLYVFMEYYKTYQGEVLIIYAQRPDGEWVVAQKLFKYFIGASCVPCDLETNGWISIGGYALELTQSEQNIIKNTFFDLSRMIPGLFFVIEHKKFKRNLKLTI